MKKLTLDYSKWRSGSEGKNKVGIGITKLLNPEGFMCCLGQFALQLGVEEKDILNVNYPRNIGKVIPGLNKECAHTMIVNTSFSGQAAMINDENDTIPEEKIKLLTKLCKDNNFELEVINKP